MKHYSLFYQPSAENDFETIFAYISQQSSEQVAESYLDRILTLCESLQYTPHRGTQINSSIKNIRKVGFERRATILFQIVEDQVKILRVLYGGQDLERILPSIVD